MDFNFAEEQKMLRETVREIALLELSPRAAELDSYNLFPWDGLRSLGQAGLMGMLLPPAVGGGGQDLLSFLIATEEIAKGCANTALVFVTHIACGQGLLIGGSDPLKQKWLPFLARGEKLAAFAATEADAGVNVLAIQTTAQKEGTGYRVNGSKVYITSADEAALYLTAVRTSPTPGPQSLSMLAIEKETEGVSFGRKFLRLGINGTSNGEIFFSNCLVAKENLLGQEGGYLPLGMALVKVGMLGAAAIALGLAQAALEASQLYGKQRVVLGQPLGNYQGVQFLIADMSCQVEAARWLLYWAVNTSAPPGPPLPAFKAKLFATEMAVKATDQALQIHGGTGYTKELPLERYYRDARGLTLHFSPTEPLLALLGQFLMGLAPF